MGDVKWIKIAVDMFSNRKIRMIESMDNGDALLVFWVKLLALAGQINDGGRIYFTPKMPYSHKALGLYLNTYETIVSQGLQIFKSYDMIEMDEVGIITIANWDKYQNVDGMERIRKQTRERVEKYRAKKKEECNASETSQKSKGATQRNVTGNATVTECNAIEEDIEEDKERDNISLTGDNARAKEKPVKHKYGAYENVLLTDEELEKLKTEFPMDWENRIERLSEYIESKGAKYKSHLATIRNWARRDAERGVTPKRTTSNSGADELEDFYAMTHAWAEGGSET